MAKKPLNPDSVKGGGMPAMGRSSQGASAAANKRAGAGAAAKKAQASTRLATRSNVSVEKIFPSGAYRVTDLNTFRTKQFMGYTKSEAIKRFKNSK